MHSQLDEANLQPGLATGEQAERGWTGSALLLVVATAVILGILLVFQGIHKGYFDGLTEVDDGVYYGEGVLMSHGVLPYRSYIDIQPPGMALLMAPFGFLGRVTSDRTAFAWARVFIALLAVANVGLMGRLLRRRHWVGLLTGIVVLGFYEASLIADHTVLLEPILVLGTLLAFLLIFDDTEVATASAGRWLGAGVLLGTSTSVKLWGVFPFVVLLYFAFKHGRRCLAHFVTGGVVAFGIICGPFFVLAPSAFWREVVVVQATRAHIDRNPFHRLASLLGVTGHSGVAVAIWVILTLIVVGSIALARRSDPAWHVTDLDATAMACVVIVGAAFLTSPEFDTHYGGFFAPFMALVLSATAVRLLPLARPLMAAVITVALLAFIGHSVKNVLDEAKASMPSNTLDRIFSPHECVITEDYGPVILANRYNLYEPDCPRVLDMYGAELTDGNGVADSPVDARASNVQSDWLDWLRHADGVVLYAPLSQYPDIGPAAKQYLRADFSLAAVSDGLHVYRRVEPR